MSATLRRILPALFLALALLPLAPTAHADDAHGLPPGAPPMDRYQLAFLRKGAEWTPGRSPRTDSLQAGHMANIHRMWEMGKLVGAGPLLDGGDLRGIYLFKADSIGEVEALAANDPAVKAGRLRLEIYDYMAPAGIGKRYDEMSKRPGFKDSMITVQIGILKRGPKYTREVPPEVQKLQGEHVARIFALLKEGKLGSAGPLMDHSEQLAGVFFFMTSAEEAKKLAEEDPLVKIGRLAIEMHPMMMADGVLR